MHQKPLKNLYLEIIDSFQKKDFFQVIEIIEKYLQIEHVGVSEELLTMYVFAQNELLLLDDAITTTKILRQLYSKEKYDSFLAYLYIKKGDLEKGEQLLQKCLEKKPNNDLCYYHLGKIYILEGKYEEAQIALNKALQFAQNETMKKNAKKTLKKIELHLKKGCFLEMNYTYFKQSQYLKPQYVIYTSVDDTEKHNYFQIHQDQKKEQRPYLIWKIIGNTIYAFPLSSAKRERVYKLYAQNYPIIGFDRWAKDRLVRIDEKNIQKVIDYIHDEDYEKILNDIYHQVCYYKDATSRKAMDFFMKDRMQQSSVEIGDILEYYDTNTNKHLFYLIIKIDFQKHSYKVVELEKDADSTFRILHPEIKNSSMNRYFLRKISLEEEKVKELTKSIPQSQKYTSLCGFKVKYHNQNLLVLFEDEDYYICVDENYALSYNAVVKIPRKEELVILSSIKKEERIQGLRFLQEYYSTTCSKKQKKDKIISLLKKINV